MKNQDPGKILSLISFLEDKDAQLVAIWALGNIEDKSSISAVTRLPDDQYVFVGYNTSQALKKIGYWK